MYEIKALHRPIEITGIYTGLDDLHRERFYFPGEFHDFWEAVLVRSGEMTATADGRLRLLKSGQVLFHKPMEFHTVRVDRVGTRLQIISFTARGEGMKAFEDRCVDLTDAELALFGQITAGFASADAHWRAGRMEDFEKESAYAAVLLESLLLPLSDRSGPRSKPLSPSERQYLDALRIMRENLDRMLSLDELASLCSMSASRLKKLFHGLSDVGAAKFFLRMKLRRAMELIDGGASVKEAALMTGFSDVNYFSVVFKRETGLTPTEYRRSVH